MAVAEQRVQPAVGFDTRVEIDTPMELAYYRAGGILPYVKQQLEKRGDAPAGGAEEL